MNSSAFCRFALTFRWLITVIFPSNISEISRFFLSKFQTEELPFPTSCVPPDHTKLRFGKVKKEMSLVPSKREDYLEMGECRICGKDIEKVRISFWNFKNSRTYSFFQLWSLVRCISATCPSHFHSKCLSENGLKLKNEHVDHVYPLKANCPTCGQFYLWGDIIREQRRIIKVFVSINSKVYFL